MLPRCCYAILVAILPATACSSSAHAQNLYPEQATLLLANGELLQGIVTQEGDRYRVSLENGEIRVQSDQVEARFASPNEAYRHLGEKIKHPTVETHLALARWCLRQDLFTEAVDELDRAKLLNPEHRGIQALAEQMLRQQAAPVANRQPSGPDKPATATDEFQRLLATLPDGSMETFTSTVQPLLLNSCSTTACHGVRSDNNYKLYRANAGTMQSTQMTQLNLRATLRFVDRGKPAASRLLSMAAEPHGKVKATLLGGETSPSYRHLERWVLGLGEKPAAEVTGEGPASVERQQVILSQAILESGRQPFDAVVPGQMSIGLTPGAEPPKTIFSGGRMPAAEAQRYAAFGDGKVSQADPNRFRQVSSNAWHLPRVEEHLPIDSQRPNPIAGEHVPPLPTRSPPLRDEFDPGIFNRRFHAEPAIDSRDGK